MINDINQILNLKSNTTYILRDGTTIDKVTYDLNPKQYDMICAKHIININKVHKWQVLCHGGILFDPEQEMDVRYIKRHNWRFRNVDQQCFDYYTKYLGVGEINRRKNKNVRSKSLLHHAERLL